jgi:hypothetical protein
MPECFQEEDHAPPLNTPVNEPLSGPSRVVQSNGDKVICVRNHRRKPNEGHRGKRVFGQGRDQGGHRPDAVGERERGGQRLKREPEWSRSSLGITRGNYITRCDNLESTEFLPISRS